MGLQKNSLIVLGFGIVLLFSLSSASALSWNPLPCVDDCMIGEVQCISGTNNAKVCGDYDTIYDFDHCYEYPPDGMPQYTQTCPYGCYKKPNSNGDICITSDPCAGIGCSPGETRCGRKCKAGTTCSSGSDYVDASYVCKKITIGGTNFNCYGWDYSDSSSIECPWGCDYGDDTHEGSGKCLSQTQGSLSDCVPGARQCADDYHIKECVDKNADGVYNMQVDPIDMTYCPNGCAIDYITDGQAYCKDADGQTDCNDCAYGSTRCNPNFKVDGESKYLQWCWNTDLNGCNHWTTDYSSFVQYGSAQWSAAYGQYCEFGCNPATNKCNTNPHPDTPQVNGCNYAGDTRCYDGSNVMSCAVGADGFLEWDSTTIRHCQSGVCQNGQCVTPTAEGYSFYTNDQNPIYITGSFDSDGINLYNNGVTTSLSYVILSKMDINNSYISNCYLNKSNITQIVHFTINSGLLYFINGSGTNYTKLLVVDNECNLITQYNLSNTIKNTTLPPTITNNISHFFIASSNSTDDYLNVYNITGDFKYLFNLIEPPGLMEYYNKKIYIQTLGTSKINIYGIDGYYFGYINLTAPISTYGFWGITNVNKNLYIKWSKYDTTSSILNSIINVYMLKDQCESTCREGGSHCVSNGMYVSKCVQVPGTNCWKYFDEVGPLFPAGSSNLYQQNCGSTQCKETWQNHYLLTAYCGEDTSCQNICEPGNWSCDETGKYRVKCISKPSPVPFNLGRKCYGWADPSNPCDITADPTCQRNESVSDYLLCSSNSVCSEGQCVNTGNQCSAGESRCKTVDKYEYVEPCYDIQNTLMWSWGNRTYCEFGCNMTFNATSNKRYAECRAPDSWDSSNVAMRNSFHELESWWWILFPDVGSQMMITMILMGAAFVAFYKGGWQLSTGAALVVLLGSLAIGMIGSYILFAILIIVALMVLPKYLKNIRGAADG